MSRNDLDLRFGPLGRHGDDIPESNENDDLVIPWWSTMLPTPIIGRNRARRAQEGHDARNMPSNQSRSQNTTRFPSRNQRSQQNIFPSPPLNDQQQSYRSLRANSSPSEPHLRRMFDESEAVRIASTPSDPEPPPLPKKYPLYTKCYCEENVYILSTYLDSMCQSRNKKAQGPSSSRRWDVDVVFVSNKDQSVALWEQRASTFPDTDHIVIWDYHVFVVVTCSQGNGALENNEAENGLTTQRRAPPSPLQRARAQLGSTFSRREPMSDGQGFLRTPSSGTSSPSSGGSRAASPSNDNTSKPSLSWVYDLDTRLPVPTPLPTYLEATFKYEHSEDVAEQFQPRFRVIPVSNFLAHFSSDRSHMVTYETDLISEPDFEESVQWKSPPPKWAAIRGPLASSYNNLFDAYVNLDPIQIGQLVPPDDRFGYIVSLSELAKGLHVGNHGHFVGFPRSSSSRRSSLYPEVTQDKKNYVDEGILRLLAKHKIPGFHNPSHKGTPQRRSRAESTPTPVHQPSSDAEQDDEPGMLLGLRRVYGVRPPPPPPGELRISSINFSNRGKRVTDPMFPAYLHATLQNRAEKEREAAAAAAAALGESAEETTSSANLL